MSGNFDLYSFPEGYAGRRTYVSVRGHKRSVPVIYTYKGTDGYNYIAPEYGGDLSGYKDFNASIGFPMLLRDMSEYVSPVDGTVVSSRSQHREHLAAHDLVEVGNERMPSAKPNIEMPNVVNDIKKAIHQVKERAVQ